MTYRWTNTATALDYQPRPRTRRIAVSPRTARRAPMPVEGRTVYRVARLLAGVIVCAVIGHRWDGFTISNLRWDARIGTHVRDVRSRTCTRCERRQWRLIGSCTWRSEC